MIFEKTDKLLADHSGRAEHSDGDSFVHLDNSSLIML